MNRVEISSDGVCVFINSEVKPSTFLKNLLRVSVIAIVIGFILLIRDENDPVGLLLFLGALVLTLPFARSIFWNIYGTEVVSISTKSVYCQYGFGFFNSQPQTYSYNKRLWVHFESIREDNGSKEGEIHFFSYDEDNQPSHLFKTTIYMTEEQSKDLISKLDLIFSLENGQGFEPSLN